MPDRAIREGRTLRLKCCNISVHRLANDLSTTRARLPQLPNAPSLLSAHVMAKESLPSSQHHSAWQHSSVSQPSAHFHASFESCFKRDQSQLRVVDHPFHGGCHVSFWAGRQLQKFSVYSDDGGVLLRQCSRTLRRTVCETAMKGSRQGDKGSKRTQADPDRRQRVSPCD